MLLCKTNNFGFIPICPPIRDLRLDNKWTHDANEIMIYLQSHYANDLASLQ